MQERGDYSLNPKNKNTRMNVLLVAALFILAHQLRYIPSSNIFATSFAMLMRSTIHISILAVWTVSLYRRLMNAQVRRILVGTGILMAFWLAAKTIKYEFLTVNTDPLGRYIWYSYYIPMLLIPLFGVFVVNHIGKPEEYRTPKWMQYLYIPAFLLIAMVLTNDLHQWVFRFDNGYANYDKDYSYGIPYFILMAWYILFVLYFVISLLRKCRVPGSRKTQKLPLIIAFGGIVFWIVYILKIVRVDLTVIDCLIIASLLESAIQCGMIPSNTGHRELFRKTTIPIQILDNDYQPHYVSATALPIHERRLRQSAVENVDLGDTLLCSAPITAGRVVWQDDVRQINEMRQRLLDTQEQLNEEIVLRQAETEIKEKHAKVDEQNRLYDRISREVEPQLVKVDALLGRIEEKPENTKSILAQICVIGSYIKRRGNLLLLGEENSCVNALELEYCIRESIENLRLYGTAASLKSSCSGKLPLVHIVSVYDFYETMTERLLDNITAIMVNLTCANGKIRMNIQMGCTEGIVTQVLDDISLSCGSFTYDIMEEDVVIDLTVLEGGVEA